jgi:hypothetical protein
MNIIMNTRNEEVEQDHKGVQEGVLQLKKTMVMTMTIALC